MTTPDFRGRPTSTGLSERKLTPDLARGFMLLLITMAYSGMYLTADDIGGYGEQPGGNFLDQLVSFLATLFLENRAFPLFGILFGVGMVMLVTRQHDKGMDDGTARRLMRRRGCWLLVFGIVHATLVFGGEILGAYGLSTLIIAWLLFRAEGALKRATVVIAAYYAVVVTVGTLAMGVFASEFDNADGSFGAMPGYSTAADWGERVGGGVASPLMNTFFFPTLLLIIIGFWIGRKKYLEEPESHLPTLRKLAVVGVSVSLLGALPLALQGTGTLGLSDEIEGLAFGLQILSGVAGGIGYVAAFALLCAKLERRRGPVVRAIAAGGQRSLTLYLFCSVLVAVMLNTDLVGLGDHLHRAGGFGVAIAVWAIGIAAMRALDQAGKPGPADQLMRHLVYRKI